MSDSFMCQEKYTCQKYVKINCCQIYFRFVYKNIENSARISFFWLLKICTIFQMPVKKVDHDQIYVEFIRNMSHVAKNISASFYIVRRKFVKISL